MEKKNNFFKKFGLPIIIGIVVIIIIILVVLLKKGKSEKLDKIDKTQSISKVSQLIAPEYQDIDCTNDCKYFYAYKGDDKANGKFDFYDESGKKIGNFDLSKIDKSVALTLDVEEISDNYFIMSFLVNDDYDYKYVVYSMKGKVLLEADDASVLTDKYLTAENDDKVYIVDNSGKVVFEDVKNVKVYNDKYITFKINDVDKIIDENGKEILSGYTIAKVVLDENEEIDYLIIRNSEDSVYNYYNIHENSKKGDSFSSYTTEDEQIIITKKVDSKNKKFILNSNGEQVEYVTDNDSKVSDEESYYDSFKEKVDTEKYGIFSSAIVEKNQNYILVNYISENKFGILDVSKEEFTELGTYKENSSRKLTLKRISANEGIDGNDDIIYSIECSTYYCDEAMQFIYNFSQNKLLANRNATKESLIYSYRLYENGYSVIKTSSSKFDDSNMYFLFNSDGEELIKSKNDIKIIDNILTYYSSSISDTGKINLYSLKAKKVINLDDDEIISVSSEKFEDIKLYQFVLDNKTYLITENGEVTELNGTLKSTDDIGIYMLNDKKITYYNVFTKETSNYELQKNESINGSTGYELVPYRNAIFVNNSYDYIIKVIGANDKVLLEKKDLQIYKISKRKDSSVLIMVIDKDDNKGIYIAR